MDAPPPLDWSISRSELEELAGRVLADLNNRRRPTPWLCPDDGEPLRGCATSFGRGASGLGPTGSTYTHVDGTEHGDLGTTIRISTPDGSFLDYDVVEETPWSDGSSTVRVRPQGRQ